VREGEKNKRYFFAGWLMDGSGGPIQKNMCIGIQDGFISDLGPADAFSNIGSADTCDLSDCTVLPGLIDSHVHLFMSGTEDRRIRDFQLTAQFNEIKGFIVTHICRHFAAGTVAVRDGGDHGGHALRFRNENYDKDTFPIHLSLAGRAWHKPGRYGKLIGRAPGDDETLAKAIRRGKEPQDVVKIVNSGVNSLKTFGKQTRPQFSVEELTAAVKTGEERGLKTMVHANGERPVDIAIRAGCHSIEHGFFMGRENLEQMAERGVVWVPTACTMKAYAKYLRGTESRLHRDATAAADSKRIQQDAADVAEKNLDHQLEQIAAAKRFGVTVALGTDAGSIGVHHGQSVADELALLIEAGFSRTEALRCATSNNAKLLGMDKCGLLKQGMAATFVVLDGGPSKFPINLNSIKALVIDGKRYGSEKR
jgi:imidazolonepropionase-like amidohydrolase